MNEIVKLKGIITKFKEYDKVRTEEYHSAIAQLKEANQEIGELKSYIDELEYIIKNHISEPALIDRIKRQKAELKRLNQIIFLNGYTPYSESEAAVFSRNKLLEERIANTKAENKVLKKSLDVAIVELVKLRSNESKI